MGHSGYQILFQLSFVGIDVNERVCRRCYEENETKCSIVQVCRVGILGETSVIENGVETVIDSDCLRGVDVLLYSMYKQRVVRAFGNSTADLDWIPA